MADEELHERMDRLIQKYSETLFTLPGRGRLLTYLLTSSLLAGLGFVLPSLKQSTGIAQAVLLSLVFPFSSSVAWALDALIMRGDPILKPRRCLGLELFSLSSLGAFSALGGAVGYFLGAGFGPALRMAFIGASLAISIRALTLASASLAGRGRCLVSTGVYPALWVISASSIALASGYQFCTADALFLISCLLAGPISASIFLLTVRSIGVKLFGVSSFRIIRGFTASWTEDLREPLEEFLDEIGVEEEVRFSILLFEDTNGRPIGALVVPGVHPGPFREIGSSPLPSLLQEALEEHLGCPVAVPHGLSGHEFNLTSRAECEKLISAVLEAFDRLDGPFNRATDVFRAEHRGAKASCQLIGPLAFITLTMAPDTMEDLPPELDDLLARLAEELGLSGVVAVDAHNSVDGPFDRIGLVERFAWAASEAMVMARASPRSPFRAGMARVVPEGFSLEEGMGPGGISALALEVGGGPRYAYVVLDGNNMIRGLRERLLEELEALGFTDGEVMTTDTHLVNARSLIKRGYHPLGEVMDWDALAGHVREACQKALDVLTPARARWGRFSVRVKVFGEEQLRKLCDLPLKAIRAVRNMALGILGPVHAVLLILAFLL